MQIANSTDFIQYTIVSKLVTELLAAGFYIDVNDREETNLAKSRDRDALMKAIFDPAIDETDYTLDLWKDPTATESDAYVFLVDGNGATVISDYTTNLEEILEPVDALVNEIDKDEAAWFQREILRGLIGRAFVAQVARLQTEEELEKGGSDDISSDCIETLNRLIANARAMVEG